MTWTAPKPPELADGPLVGDDRPILEAYLAWQRHTLLTLCAGLTGEQLATRALPPSNLSLLGLVRHLAKVERIWLRQRAAGEAIDPMYSTFDGVVTKDADFNELAPRMPTATSPGTPTSAGWPIPRSRTWDSTTHSPRTARRIRCGLRTST